MKIRFLGTGAAEGVPAVFCNCKICGLVRKLGEAEFRTRAQVLIDGCLSVDFPPDAYAHSLKYGIKLGEVRYILATHSHMDHFYAHDFILRGYKYASLSGERLEIYGNAEVGKVYSECTAREMKPEVAPNINFTEIKPYQSFSFGGYNVLTLPANHSKVEDALLYYIEKDGKSYLHFYDTGRLRDGAVDHLAERGARADAVCFDCTFIEQTGGFNARHMGIEDVMYMKDKLSGLGIIDERTKIIISHFSHNSNPTRQHLNDIETKYGVTAAYDGMVVEI